MLYLDNRYSLRRGSLHGKASWNLKPQELMKSHSLPRLNNREISPDGCYDLLNRALVLSGRARQVLSKIVEKPRINDETARLAIVSLVNANQRAHVPLWSATSIPSPRHVAALRVGMTGRLSSGGLQLQSCPCLDHLTSGHASIRRR